MADSLFRLLAEHYPTHRMGERKVLATLWRFLFYVLRPRRPFIMRTRDYRLLAHPQRGTLTRTVIRRGYWEPQETDTFRSLLKPGMFVIDAGANFGHYALTAANKVGPTGLVIAFEPHPDSFALLDANRKLLPHDNLLAVQAGLGPAAGTMKIYTDLENPGGHSVYDWNLLKTDGSSHRAPVCALDAYLSERIQGRSVDFLKIDVQGYEMEVLRGATQIIERDHPAILCEITPDALHRAGSGLEEILEFFRSRGYRAEDPIVTDQRVGIQTLDYAELPEFFRQFEYPFYNILFRFPGAPASITS